MRWKNAHQHKDQRSFEPFHETGGKENPFAEFGRRHIAFARDHGSSEKARAGADERKKQNGGSLRIAGGIGEGEAQGNGAVKEEVEGNVEEGTAIGHGRRPSDGTVEAVEKAIEKNGQKRQTVVAGSKQRHSGERDQETSNGQLVCGYPQGDERARYPPIERCQG